MSKIKVEGKAVPGCIEVEGEKVEEYDVIARHYNDNGPSLFGTTVVSM